MKPIRALVVALALTVTAIGPGAVTPARAHEDVCAGTFWMQFYPGTWGYPNLSPRTASNYAMNMPAGICAVALGGLWTSGWMIGDCGYATGYGYSNYGHRFDLKWIGDTMTFTGGVVGTVHAWVDPFVYRNSCLDGTAWHLTMTGTLTSVHVP